MARKKRLSFDERKQAIKHAAIRIFVQQGFENTTMEDLIKDQGYQRVGFITTTKIQPTYSTTLCLMALHTVTPS